MLIIDCPWCGPRDETEFRYGGQAGVPYPTDPHGLDDAEWSRYLFVRDNPKGWFTERWVHTAGCRRWFTAVRDTVTYQIRSTEPPTAHPETDQATTDRKATAGSEVTDPAATTDQAGTADPDAAAGSEAAGAEAHTPAGRAARPEAAALRGAGGAGAGR